MKLLAAVTFTFGLLLSAPAFADSITPSTYSAELDLGESVTITKTVTISAGLPTSAKVDVFFLADTTGSMGSLIASVAANASSIMSGAAGLGDVAFGVGEYRDFGDAFAYRLNQDITTNTAAVQTGIDAWSASGGGDFPEANLFGLSQVATTTGWRDDSTRILIWFGDAPGHDPSGGVTQASAIAALQAANITVEGINVGSLDSTGQATAIAAATGGQVFNGLAGDLTSIIGDAIDATFAEYSMVSLATNGAEAPGVGVAFSPLSYSGSYDRSIDRTFTFDVTFTGLLGGSYDFTINALVDGGIVATETDFITVAAVPGPAALPLLVTGLGFMGLMAARRRRNTA